ncbi:MAG: ECF transporter S component [Eubacteriales bacterium]|nr:ECF transporter S component [Eubacteriales bacterium]
MSEKSIDNTKKKNSVRKCIVWMLILILVPATLIVSWKYGNRRYYLTSVLVIVYSILAFVISFESRKPQAREIVTIAVMSALSVAARAAFAMVPFFKPSTAIIMITGIAMGPEAGFLTGAACALVSNFLFGQGPWTPWQMFAYGIAGVIMGALAKTGVVSEKKKLLTSVIGFVCVMLIVGPILDTCSLFTMSTEISKVSVTGIYMAGIPVNAVHSAATFLTLLLFCRPLAEKLERIKIKYGMMDGEQ